MHGFGPVVVNLQIEGVGTADLFVNFAQRQRGHLHGHIGAVGSVKYAGHKGFNAQTAIGALA